MEKHLELTQIAGGECKVTALTDSQIINILETFRPRAISKVNYFHGGLVICTPNETPTIELLKELTLNKDGVERTLSHNKSK